MSEVNVKVDIKLRQIKGAWTVECMHGFYFSTMFKIPTVRRVLLKRQ